LVKPMPRRLTPIYLSQFAQIGKKNRRASKTGSRKAQNGLTRRFLT
jgi:hypothetical protein